MRFRPAFPETMLGVFMIGFAVVVAYATAAIPQSTYAKIGPAVVPWAITAGLFVLGILLTLEGLRGGWWHDEATQLDWRGILWLGAGLLSNLVLIDGVEFGGKQLVPAFGFILSSTLLFACTARAFGSPNFLRDGAIGFTLALVAYVGFDRVLGYQIGSGLVERFI